MKDSQQQQTTLSGCKEIAAGTLWVVAASGAHLIKTGDGRNRYGWVKIISAEKTVEQKNEPLLLLTECTGCGSIQWQELGSYSAEYPRAVSSVLKNVRSQVGFTALSAAKQRARIQMYQIIPIMVVVDSFDFPSVTQAGLYLISALGLPNKRWK